LVVNENNSRLLDSWADFVDVWIFIHNYFRISFFDFTEILDVTFQIVVVAVDIDYEFSTIIDCLLVTILR
jgi:hypothetical protein